jgi:hypothetical protein
MLHLIFGILQYLSVCCSICTITHHFSFVRNKTKVSCCKLKIPYTCLRLWGTSFLLRRIVLGVKRTSTGYRYWRIVLGVKRTTTGYGHWRIVLGVKRTSTDYGHWRIALGVKRTSTGYGHWRIALGVKRTSTGYGHWNIGWRYHICWLWTLKEKAEDTKCVIRRHNS